MEKSPNENSVQIVSINYKNREDLEYAKYGCGDNIAFYKFPVKGSYPKTKCKYIAFYLSDNKCFEKDKRGITSYAKIIRYNPMKRRQICNDKEFLKKHPERNNDQYFKIEISKLIKLNHKIRNKLGSRVSYRYTTLDELQKSQDISQLSLNKRRIK